VPNALVSRQKLSKNDIFEELAYYPQVLKEKK
jgi:hypothetical protein